LEKIEETCDHNINPRLIHGDEKVHAHLTNDNEALVPILGVSFGLTFQPSFNFKNTFSALNSQNKFWSRLPAETVS
jgi:hypothetical protein